MILVTSTDYQQRDERSFDELKTNMHHYFPERDQETASLQWIIHPFSAPDDAIHDDDFPAKEECMTM